MAVALRTNNTAGGGSGATEAKQDELIALATGPTTGTPTSVASGTTSVGILAANANRKGATITNTDANTLRLLLSAGTASATVFTVAILTDGYYEVPFGYTGDIVGVWDADGSGAALVTEFT